MLSDRQDHSESENYALRVNCETVLFVAVQIPKCKALVTTMLTTFWPSHRDEAAKYINVNIDRDVVVPAQC